MGSNPNELAIKYYPVANLMPLQKNSKLHDIGQIAALIRRYGFKDPIKFEPALNNMLGGIVEGNGRLETLMWMQSQDQEVPRGIRVDESGEWCVPVILGVDAQTEAEAIAYSLDHNNSVLSGGSFTAVDASRMWEREDYLEILEELRDADELPEAVDDEDLDLMMRLLKEEDFEDFEEEKSYRKPEGEPKDPLEGVDKRSNSGQVWKLGRHTLIIGDSCNEEKLKSMNLNPDLVVADPPFGINLMKDKTKGKVGKDNIYKTIAGDDSLEVVSNFLHLHPRLFPDSKFCIWGANHFCHLLTGSSGWIIWDKRGEDMPPVSFADCEIAWTNVKFPARVYRQVWYGMIREGKGESAPRFHVNQKPVALYQWIYQQLLPDAKGTVLDPFCGSGSSILAAEEFDDVTVTAWEIDPDFANVVIHRWEAKTGETAVAI